MRPDGDPDRVDAPASQPDGSLTEPVELVVIDALPRVGFDPGGPARLHLHGDEAIAEVGDQIDLVATDPAVPVDDARTASLEEAGCERFAVAGEVGPGQCAAGRSSSSTLTSLNVITVTRSTKRAGRYMSHTHASSSWSSK